MFRIHVIGAAFIGLLWMSCAGSQKIEQSSTKTEKQVIKTPMEVKDGKDKPSSQLVVVLYSLIRRIAAPKTCPGNHWFCMERNNCGMCCISVKLEKWA